ncbi:MAG: dTDP-4-dehydrorhamnose 3,5-epimerase [Flavobacteriaceae bacterium]|jgi:dTDP-4-dehydrorhamnose 3,5-epimerase|nr:dTDP-4-dehydrorhamnose 3,5-epimerase [Flavobacteriaceae bacterium]
MGNQLDKIKFKSQKKIETDGGDIYHIMKIKNHQDFEFKEAYFSFIEFDFVKGWKKHLKMYSNLIVPIGEVKFTFVSEDFKNVKQIILGNDNYGLLSIPPNIWFSFKGISKDQNIILNLSNLEHDKKETKNIKLEEFPLKINL